MPGHGSSRLKELEEMLSHDEFEQVTITTRSSRMMSYWLSGSRVVTRSDLWAELAQLLIDNPALRTFLVIPDDVVVMKDPATGRIHGAPPARTRAYRGPAGDEGGLGASNVRPSYRELIRAEEIDLRALRVDAAVFAHSFGPLLNRGALFAVQKLDISLNNLGDAGLAAVAGVIRSERLLFLRWLAVGSASVGDDGLIALAEALAYAHQNLESLWLGNNRYTETGLLALFDAYDGGGLLPLAFLLIDGHRYDYGRNGYSYRVLTDAGVGRMADLIGRDALLAPRHSAGMERAKLRLHFQLVAFPDPGQPDPTTANARALKALCEERNIDLEDEDPWRYVSDDEFLTHDGSGFHLIAGIGDTPVGYSRGKRADGTWRDGWCSWEEQEDPDFAFP